MASTLCCSFLGAAALVLVVGGAEANSRPLPFTYPYETLPEDSIEVEQYVDTTFVRRGNADGTRGVFDATYRLQTELEYGITDRLELGLYLVFQQSAPVSGGDPTLAFDGVKQRLRYRIGDEGDLPIETALYFEVVERHDEFALEQKLILQKRFGAFKWMTNLWVEQEWARGKSMELVFNPTTGLAWQLDPRLWLGIEYWMRGTLENEAIEHGAPPDSVDAFNAAVHHFAGPTLMLAAGRFWWSTGVYFRLDRLARAADVGDRYGKVWIRSVVGIDL